MSDEIAAVLYPQQGEAAIYGKAFFKTLEEKGILRKGKGRDTNYYLHDEVKECLATHLNQKYNASSKFYLDAPEVIQLNKDLAAFYDVKAIDPYIEKDKKTHLYLLEASYHDVLSCLEFELKYPTINQFRSYVADVLLKSVLLDSNEIRAWAKALPNQKEEEVLKFLEARAKDRENLKFFFSVAVIEAIQDLKANGNLSEKWYNEEDFYLTMLAKFPTESGILGTYAVFLQNQKQDFEQAENFYLRAIEAEPNHANNLGNYANFLADQKQDFEHAESFYLRAIEANPNHANNLGNYANFLADQKQDFEHAESFYLRAIEANPNHIFTLFMYPILLHHHFQDYNKASLFYQKAIDNGITHQAVLGNYAQIQLIQGNVKDGKKLINQAFEQNPQELDILTELWFYRFAHFPEWYEQAEKALHSLIEQGAKSLGWNLQVNVDIAKANGHPKP
ncbi:MAG: hypothetical protein ACK4TA_07240, partial [Saprospiraceae bacterium]